MTEKIEEVIDVEQYAKEGQKIPHAPRYRIRIDKMQYVVDKPAMTGYDLLNLAGKTPPERFAIYKKLHGGQAQKIELNEVARIQADIIESVRKLNPSSPEQALEKLSSWEQVARNALEDGNPFPNVTSSQKLFYIIGIKKIADRLRNQ